MLYLSVDRNLATPEASQLRPEPVSRRRGFWSFGDPSVRCHGTAGSVVDDHPVIPYARVNGIISASCDHCFGTMEQYCFHDASTGPNFATFLYIELALISNYISVPALFDISGFCCNTHFYQTQIHWTMCYMELHACPQPRQLHHSPFCSHSEYHNCSGYQERSTLELPTVEDGSHELRNQVPWWFCCCQESSHLWWVFIKLAYVQYIWAAPDCCNFTIGWRQVILRRICRIIISWF